ncbi:MAG: hypothetical protein PUA56_03130 [Bacillales bacterium]|nr:hypothetical protein [Bacillales bacterium]
MKKLSYKDFILSICMMILLLSTLIEYFIFFNEPLGITIILELIVSILVPLSFPLINLYLKERIPFSIQCLICSHLYFAIHLGTCLGFYVLISWWDLFLHGLFGFIATAILYIYIPKINKYPISPLLLGIIIFLSIMGLAALWEVFEYLSDLILGGDTQKVIESINNGKSPVADTIEDIMITPIGLCIFYIGLGIKELINKHNKKK